MDLLLLILISGGAVIGSCYFAYSMIKSGMRSISTNAVTGLIASQTGVDKSAVQSLVGKKPYATNSEANVEGIANAITGSAKGGKFIAGLASKIPGPIGAAAGAAMIGLGATAAVGEAITKPGLRAISENATKIANSAKLRFTGSKLGKGLIEGKNKINNGINSVKNGITDFENNVKKAVNEFNQGIKNSAPVRSVIKGVKTVGQARDNVANSLADTWGYNTLIKNGKELIGSSTRKRHGGAVRISNPSRDPLLGRFTGNQPETRERFAELSNISNSEFVQQNIGQKYKSETLKEFIKAKREGNQRVMGSYYAKEYAEAKTILESSENSRVSLLKQRMMLDVVKNSSRDLKKDELLKATNEMYDNYIEKQGDKLIQAQKAAEEKNEKVALETVENFFGKKGGKNSKGVKTELTKKLDEYLDETYEPKNEQERKKLRQETWEEIAGNLNGVAAKAILTDDERAKISQKIESNSRQNVQFEVAKIENKQVQEYRANNPNATLSEARNEVKKQNDEKDYKKALEETLAKVELHIESNNTGAQVHEPQGIAQQPQQIVQQTTVTQNIEQISEPQNVQQQQVIQNIVQSSGVSERVVEVAPRTEVVTERIITESTSQPTQVVEKVTERVVEGGSNNTTINNNTARIDSETIDQVANAVSDRVIVPFKESLSKSVDWIQKLGDGDMDRGINRITETMNRINNGLDANSSLSKPMEKMFKELGNGSVEIGAKYLERAVKNLEEGNNKQILGDSDKNELLYTIADHIKKDKKPIASSGGTNQIAG